MAKNLYKNLYKIRICISLLIITIFVSLTSQIALAETPYRGSLHQHTGYSTWWGYDGNPLTFGDDCQPRALEGNILGYTVEELANQADDLNLDYLGFSDHSYCIDSGEFNTVESDCSTEDANRAGFTCLMGEEVSAAEIVDDIEAHPLITDCSVLGIGDDGEAHLGAYGIDNYISQTPVAEHCPDIPNAQGAIDDINQNGISIINHPYSVRDFIEFLDFESIDAVSGETGIEIWNGEWDSSIFTGTDDEAAFNLWLNKLQQDEKVYAYGGTDEHGEPSTVNYNYVFLNSLTSSNLEADLASGTNVVSNNGYVRIKAKTNTQGSWTDMGGSLDAYTGEVLTVRINHNVENACTLTVRRSEIGSYLEFPQTFSISGTNEFDIDYPLTATGDYYFRAECIGSGGDYRTYTNPIWVNVLSPSCQCTNWAPGSCGAGSCSSDQRQYTRTCTPSGCASETQCTYDSVCSGSGGEPTNCVEPGYDWCTKSQSNDCTVSIAMNAYENVNDIQWGAVNDAWDPYVIGEYKIGWKDVDAEQMYYNVVYPGYHGEGDCYYGGCNTGEELVDIGTKVTVTAPGTAHFDKVLGYDDTPNWACWVWFNGFNPNYGSDNPIYVLKCFGDSDCSSGKFCDKSGSWSSWDCVSKKSNGQSCTFDSQCQSNYCDNDGVGLSDDGWCFAPYNSYFDGQETSYCEYSTDSGLADCDERQVGDDLNKCVGTSYYEEECSSTCNYQDVTSVFECTETGCSCAQPLCDGLTTGDDITICASGESYFADECTSTASGQDRGDNICRSSAFNASCTADAECNGITAGTGNCNSSCDYVPDNPPTTTLISPSNNFVDEDGTVTFNCSATDDYDLDNITLYGNWNGWHANETKNLSGTSDSATFTKTLGNGIYIWNCLSYDNESQSDWADANWTINVSITTPQDTYKSIIKNSSNDNVAWLGDLGNVVLKGMCNPGGICNAPADSFIIKNNANEVVAYIDNNGNLCIETGDCSSSASCSPTNDAFIIKNYNNEVKSYIDVTGDLCYIGTLYENYL